MKPGVTTSPDLPFWKSFLILSQASNIQMPFCWCQEGTLGKAHMQFVLLQLPFWQQVFIGASVWHLLVIPIIAHNPQQNIRQDVLIQTQTDPSWKIQQRHQSHEIERIVGIVPGTGVILSQSEAPAELPHVDEADVDGKPLQGSPSSPEVQMEVELLHHEAAAPIHEEGPQGRVAPQGLVRLLKQVEHRGEDHLVQEAMHPEEHEAQDAG